MKKLINFINHDCAWFFTNGYKWEQQRPRPRLTPIQIYKGNMYLGRVEDILKRADNTPRHIPALRRIYDLSVRECGKCVFIEQLIEPIKEKHPNLWNHSR